MTVDLMRTVRYEGAYMFHYSARENTKAWKMGDDIPHDVKVRRLNEIIEIQNTIAKEINEQEVGRVHEILLEGPGRKHADQWRGRTDTNKTVFVPLAPTAEYVIGDLINVRIVSTTSASLIGEYVGPAEE